MNNIEYLPFTKNQLRKEVSNGFVNIQKHSNYDLYIYNYSQKTQFDRHWNDVTLNCRGLILDGDFNIIARPFKKFFNFEEIYYIVPNEPFEVTEKLDGSMFIVCRYKHFIITATRGSFNSDQAEMGRNILRNKYIKKGINPFEEGLTYVFELIYKENKIVIDYGDISDIFLLAIINNETGIDISGKDLPQIGFNTVPVILYNDNVNVLFELKKQNIKNKEGFVVKFLNSGVRIKIKFDDYFRLHRIIYGMSERKIWECLSNNQSLDEFLINVPDEFYKLVQKINNKFVCLFDKIVNDAVVFYNYIINEQKNVLNSKKFKTKKEVALYIQTAVPKNLQPIVFCMINNKDYKRVVWRMLKPTTKGLLKVLIEN